MSTPTAPSIDIYAEQPSFWRQNANQFGALAVGVLTVLLTVISFPPFKMPEFAYAFAVPAIFWAYLRPSFRYYAGTVLTAQAIAWTILLGWLHHVTWLGLLLLGPFTGIWVGLWYLAVWWTVPRMRGRQTSLRIAAMLGLAGLWVLLEWTRTWFLSGFPWLPLAASQWQRAMLLQIASYTGSGGVSFILITFNFGFAAYAHRLLRERETGMRRRSPEFVIALMILMLPSFLLLQEMFGQKRRDIAKVALVQPYIPQEVKWDPERAPGILDILRQTTLQAAATRPDLIVWPEAVTPLAIKGDESARAWAEALVRRAGVPLLLGSVAVERTGDRERWTNGAFVVDPESGLAPVAYTKRHLVPFGEYVPLRPLLGWIGKFVPIGDDFQVGEDASLLLVPLRRGPVVIAPLICYEDTYPSLARMSALAGADVLAVLTNNGWFGEGGAAYQHAAHSVLRAVETRRPVLRCGNGGWSGWIDEYGNIRFTMTNDADTIYFRGTRTVLISRDQRWEGRQSFYVQHGDWFLFVCFALGWAGFAAVTIGRPPAEEIEEPPVA
jgi:apolipoprotein N-acyltransferase